MPWSVKPKSELGLIEIVYTGRVTNHDIMAAATKALAIAKEAGPARFLTNLSDVEVLELSTLDIYDLPERWQSLLADRRNRSAILVPDSEAIMKAAELGIFQKQAEDGLTLKHQANTDAHIISTPDISN